MPKRFAPSLFLLCLALPFWTPAQATLGEDAAGADADSRRMNAARRIVPARAYGIHELQTPAGTVVREYVGPDGKVFAVSWRGPHMPDLRQLLGRHFAAYQELARGPRAQRGGISVESPELVVQSAGRMRSFAGRAFLKGKVPDGVPVGDIR